MALRHAILSALSRGEPRTGYALNASFHSSVDRAWHASPSQVYAELLRMEKAGLIEVNERDERGRTEYVITGDGLAELRRWLMHDDVDRSIRDDATLRLLTVWVLDDEKARYAIEAEIAYQRKRQIDLQRIIKEWDRTHQDTRVWRTRRAMQDLWLAEVNAKLRWLSGLLEVFEEPGRPVAAIFDEASLLKE